MKCVIPIYIEAEIAERAKMLKLNRSAICEEALRLAIIGSEPSSTSTTPADRLGKFLNYKLQMLSDEKILKRVYVAFKRKPNTINQSAMQKVARAFQEKYSLSWAEVIAKAGGAKEAPPATPEEKEQL